MKIHKGLILAILAIAQFMVVLDASIVNVALPAISSGLHFSASNLQWVVTAYTLAFGGFLLFGGRAADIFGRRRSFMIGLIAFTIGSMIVGVSQNETMMIAARAVQGLAAAFMSPAALSIVLTEFREGADRNRALGVWAAVAAGGGAAGLLLGGFLTQYFGWRWDFFINVPVGIILAIMAMRFVPKHESQSDHRVLDLPGAVLVTGGLMALVYGLSQSPTWGWGTAQSNLWLTVAGVLLALFVGNEARSKHPLMPLGIFKIRNLSGANLTQLPITAAMFSMFYFVSLYAQDVLGYSPLQAGLSFLPFTVVLALTATNASRVIARIGYKPLMIAGPLLLATGLFILSSMSVGSTYTGLILPGILFMSFGAGMSFVSISIAATSGVKQSDSGIASGLLNTAQQIGGAIGLAVLSGVAATTIKNSLTDAGINAMKPAIVKAATVNGYHTALMVGAYFAIGAAIVAFVVIQNRRGAANNRADVVEM